MTGKEVIELAIAKTESGIRETEKQLATMQGVLLGFQKSRAQLMEILKKLEEDANKKRKK